MKNKLAVLAALSALFALIFASSQVIEASRYALTLCADLILPSLFPFFVLCGVLSRLGFPAWLGRLLGPLAQRLFRVSGPGSSALFVGLSGGYPMGAAYVAELWRGGQISAWEAERLLAFCNNSGPAFLVGAVGAGVFGSGRIGLLLYLVHAAAAVLSGILLRPKEAPESPGGKSAAAAPQTLSQALPGSVRQAVLSVLQVCGFVICFTVFTGLLESWGLFSAAARALSALLGTEIQWSRALLTGLLELGSGVGALRGLAVTPLNLALAAGMVGWGGLSVQFQTMSVLTDTEIKGALHLTGRLLSACLSAALAYGLAVLLL